MRPLLRKSPFVRSWRSDMEENQDWCSVNSNHSSQASPDPSSPISIKPRCHVNLSEVQKKQQTKRDPPINFLIVPPLESYEILHPEKQVQNLRMTTKVSLWNSNTLLAVSFSIIFLAAISGKVLVLNILSVIVLARAATIMGKWMTFISQDLQTLQLWQKLLILKSVVASETRKTLEGKGLRRLHEALVLGVGSDMTQYSCKILQEQLCRARRLSMLEQDRRIQELR